MLLIYKKAPGKIAPKENTDEYFALINVLSYLATEVHPSIGGLFNPTITESVKEFITGNAARKLEYLEKNLIGDRKFLVGESFTIADSYLYIILSWTKYVGIDLSPYAKVNNYFNAIGNLENVKAAHKRIESNPPSTI